MENCKKESSVDANTDKIVTMTQDSINEQKQTLADIAKHKDEAAKQIEDTLHKAVAKILKEETLEPAKVEEPKPVSKTRMSQIFEQVDEAQDTTWPLNQSFDNPIVAISSDNHCSNFSYFGFSDKQGNHANNEKGNTMQFDPDQVKKVKMAFTTDCHKCLNVIELFDKDNRSLGKIGGDC